MSNTEKPYNFITSTEQARASLVMKTKGTDGRFHSANCPYPLYKEVENPETHKIEVVKQSRKQVEKYLYDVVLGA